MSSSIVIRELQRYLSKCQKEWAIAKLGVSSFWCFKGLIVWDRTLKRERKEWHLCFNGGRKRATVARRCWWRWRIRIGQWWSWRVRWRTIFSSQRTRSGQVVPETGHRGCKNAKQLTWVLMLKAHCVVGCLTSIAFAMFSLAAISLRVEPTSTKSKTRTSSRMTLRWREWGERKRTRLWKLGSISATKCSWGCLWFYSGLGFFFLFFVFFFTDFFFFKFWNLL